MVTSKGSSCWEIESMVEKVGSRKLINMFGEGSMLPISLSTW